MTETPWTPKPLDYARKVAIVGFASSSRDQAPYRDDAFEVWSLNHAYQWIPRFNRWFEIHAHDHVASQVVRDGVTNDGQEHLKWLQDRPADPADKDYSPIYMQQHYDDIQASVRFPREEINAWFKEQGASLEGFYADDYYTSSISQMLALAIYEGFGEIHLYGIDLLQDDEYFYQRAGCEYLVGFARGRGHKVYVPKPSALCKANYTYGYSWPPSDLGQMQPLVEFIEKREQQSEGTAKKVISDGQVYEGALQMARLTLQLIDSGKTPEETRKAVADKLADMERRKADIERALLQVTGQAEAFKSMGIWAKHWARGGRLDG